jgi:hypothetical protein
MIPDGAAPTMSRNSRLSTSFVLHQTQAMIRHSHHTPFKGNITVGSDDTRKVRAVKSTAHPAEFLSV